MNSGHHDLYLHSLPARVRVWAAEGCLKPIQRRTGKGPGTKHPGDRTVSVSLQNIHTLFRQTDSQSSGLHWNCFGIDSFGIWKMFQDDSCIQAAQCFVIVPCASSRGFGAILLEDSGRRLEYEDVPFVILRRSVGVINCITTPANR